MATLDQLTAMLDALEARLPGLVAGNRDPGDFWMAFAGEADLIEDQAGAHMHHVARRIEAMLAQHGRYIAVVEQDKTRGT